MSQDTDIQELKQLVKDADPAFWSRLAACTEATDQFDQLIFLSSLRKRALARGIARPDPVGEPLRLGLVGGCSLYPLSELLEHVLDAAGFPVELFSGDYDNYAFEVSDPTSELNAFEPDVLCLIPSSRLAQSTSGPLESRDAVEAEARNVARHLLDLCAAANAHSGCDVALANFPLPGRFDMGPYRARAASSTWTFRKLVNLELGLEAPNSVRICDAEFLTNRRGALVTMDDRGWFESKQPGSPDFLVDLAREFASIAVGLRRPQKKVLVLDLDNTCWGGVIGDDGLEGIEIGDTSPRGEAFKAFQRYAKSLKDRGVLLAVCSKNDHERAREPFEEHPDMVLRMEDFASFYANWDPKADNIRQMAQELNLGLDSFVFVDDNAAEIEIVRQFAPEVTAIHLGDDPSRFLALLQDARLFEPSSITSDDLKRSDQYRSENERKQLLSSAVDMDAYLSSMEMEGTVHSFRPVDVPRLSQLINKSNQFNLTTRRRSEGEVTALIDAPEYEAFSVRLADRFGDHGLIAIAIGHVAGATLEIDTWLMSCRVLKRQVEEEVLNEFVLRAQERGCTRIRGVYLPTKKNGMVRDLYPRLGFETESETEERSDFSLDLEAFEPNVTHITITRDAHEPV